MPVVEQTLTDGTVIIVDDVTGLHVASAGAPMSPAPQPTMTEAPPVQPILGQEVAVGEGGLSLPVGEQVPPAPGVAGPILTPEQEIAIINRDNAERLAGEQAVRLAPSVRVDTGTGGGMRSALTLRPLVMEGATTPPRQRGTGGGASVQATITEQISPMPPPELVAARDQALGRQGESVLRGGAAQAGAFAGAADVREGVAQEDAVQQMQIAQIIQESGIVALTSSQDCVKENIGIYRERRDTLVDGLNAIGLP